MNIYTLGYSGWSIEGVEAILERLDAILVDVRMVPRSRVPVWNSGNLARRLGTRYLWLHADTYGEPAHVAWLIQKFLKRFRPDQCWSLTYANTCSKPRVGEFSGGAVFVTANEIKFQDASDFVEQQRAEAKVKSRAVLHVEEGT